MAGLLFGRRVFDVLEFVYDFLELGEGAEFEVVPDVQLLVHEVDELLRIVLLFENLLSEESLFFLFVLVHFCFNQFSKSILTHFIHIANLIIFPYCLEESQFNLKIKNRARIHLNPI